MPRDFAQVYQSIWSDQDFRHRGGDEQLLYLKLLSWETLNYAGVLPLQPRKWARATADGDAQTVEVTLKQLDAARYALVDWDTEEVLLRTFIRGDGLWRNPPMLRAALRLAQQVESPRLREALGVELLAIRELVSEALRPAVEDALGTLLDGVPHGVHDPLSYPVPDGVETPSETPVPDPVAHGVPDPVPDGAGVGAGVVVGSEPTTREGIVQEADARATPVPDTRPAPLEEHDRTQARTAPPAPAAIEGAMPPDRCPLHRELHEAPPCGRCADARRAREAWIADRDAKVTAAREQAQAEIAEQRRLERLAIDACDRCDDRGVTMSGVRCTHDAGADRSSPGRAEWRTARRELAQRAQKRAEPEAGPPATGEQLEIVDAEIVEEADEDPPAAVGDDGAGEAPPDDEPDPPEADDDQPTYAYSGGPDDPPF